MILRTKNLGEVVIFELEGQLDFESTLQFQQTARTIMSKNKECRFVFNFEKLQFVGSSGINHFIRVMKDFNKTTLKPKICHVSPEFLKIMRALETNRNPFDIFSEQGEAVENSNINLPKRKPRMN